MTAPANLAFAEQLVRNALGYYAHALIDFRAAQQWRAKGWIGKTELRMRTGRYFATCAAGSLALALRHARAP